MPASILQPTNATPTPLNAHGASALPSSQLAEPSIRPENSQHPFSNAATLVRTKKSLRPLRTSKMMRMTKSQFSMVCSAEDTKEVENITDQEEIAKVDTINGVEKDITAAMTIIRSQIILTDLHTMAKLTEPSDQSSLLSL